MKRGRGEEPHRHADRGGDLGADRQGVLGPTACTGSTTPTARPRPSSARISKQGGDSWFFITVDYAFGLAIEQDATQFIKAAGGKVLGSARHPLNTADFSSYLLQAQASKAKGLMIANGGNDIINARQAGGRVRPGQAGHADQRAAGAVSRRARRRPQDRAGPADREPVLLGHDARGARLHRPLRQGDGPAAHLHPGRHLRRRAALPEGGEGRRHRRGQGRAWPR